MAVVAEMMVLRIVAVVAGIVVVVVAGMLVVDVVIAGQKCQMFE